MRQPVFEHFWLKALYQLEKLIISILSSLSPGPDRMASESRHGTLKFFLSYLCHHAGSTFWCLVVPSIYASSCAVYPICFNGLQIQIQRCEHFTAFKLSILVHGEGEISLSLISQVGSTLQDPVSVAVMWEAHADKHLTNQVKRTKYARDA